VAWLGEVLEIRCRPGEILARAVEAQPFVPVLGAGHFDPAGQVVDFLTGRLREKVIRDAQRQLTCLGQFDDGAVVVGEVALRTTRSAASSVTRGISPPTGTVDNVGQPPEGETAFDGSVTLFLADTPVCPLSAPNAYRQRTASCRAPFRAR
jgi:hypothetical protein